MPYVGAIGSRDIGAVDQKVPTLFALAIQYAVIRGCVIKTGAATGFDQLAAEIALESDGEVKLVLPYPNFEKPWVQSITSRYPNKVEVCWYNPKDPTQKHWADSVTVYHPAARLLTPTMFNLHARNYGIVEDTVAVIAAPRGLEDGGTGQGIRICRGIGRTLYNLADLKDRQVLITRMGVDDDGKPNL